MFECQIGRTLQYVCDLYFAESLRRNGGCRTWTALELGISVRKCRSWATDLKDAGFDIPDPDYLYIRDEMNKKKAGRRHGRRNR